MMNVNFHEYIYTGNSIGSPCSGEAMFDDDGGGMTNVKMSMQTIIVIIAVTALVSGGVVALALLQFRKQRQRLEREGERGMSMSSNLLARGDGDSDGENDLASLELSLTTSGSRTESGARTGSTSGSTSGSASGLTGYAVHGSRDGVVGDSAERIYASWSKSNAQVSKRGRGEGMKAGTRRGGRARMLWLPSCVLSPHARTCAYRSPPAPTPFVAHGPRPRAAHFALEQRHG